MTKKNNGNGNTTAIATLDKNISDNILNRVSVLEKEGGLQFPPNYSYANALKSAWLVLQSTLDKDKKPVLNTCTKESIANSLLDMVIQGLSPAKNQCYFVAYGKQLTLMRSYFGTIAVTRRVANIKDAFARVIYEGDVFEYHFDTQTGRIVIDKHEQNFQNIDPNKIVGAYAVIVLDDGTIDVSEPMTFEQIKKAWNQGATNGKSPAHQNFPEEMSKKTVLNRKCKMYFNTSDDSDLLIEAINRTTGNEYVNDTQYEEVVEDEIQENANKELLDVHVSDESKDEVSKEINWESPISIIEAIKAFKNTKDINDFKKKFKSRRSTFNDKDLALVDNALAEKEDEVLRGF